MYKIYMEHISVTVEYSPMSLERRRFWSFNQSHKELKNGRVWRSNERSHWETKRRPSERKVIYF